jgi:hypothetical protein
MVVAVPALLGDVLWQVEYRVLGDFLATQSLNLQLQDGLHNNNAN